MNRLLLLGLFFLNISFTASASEGLIRYESPYSVDETMARFKNIVLGKGFTVFSVIDHQQNAAKVGLALEPTQVILFGNPKVGTRLMQCAQNTAIDLPQKVLITEDENKVWLAYNDPSYLKNRHLIKGCDSVINKVSGALSSLSKAAIAK
ncbi:DUF302 domain-containing protein [uncultured Paraglaciecola sp.]|uniref:DUF302 domain-containing protein n=1 Tax=uncultured Paraglaciecola sp. TaxID=1765024 RepID=UPI00259401AD|nr:DUF302 domain-containing protein [uncultured Paraglaciecola sp.]